MLSDINIRSVDVGQESGVTANIFQQNPVAPKSYTKIYIKTDKKTCFPKNPIIRKLVENFYSKLYTTVIKPVNKLCQNLKLVTFDFSEKYPSKNVKAWWGRANYNVKNNNFFVH